MQKACPLPSCKAQPGELCGPNNSGKIPHEATGDWPHGVHYSRGYATSTGREGLLVHDDTPREELTEEEWRAVAVAAQLRRAGRS